MSIMPGNILSTLDALSHLIVPLLLGAATVIVACTKRNRAERRRVSC